MAKRWFKSQRARLDLLEKYHTKIEKALNSVQAGQFLQIENIYRKTKERLLYLQYGNALLDFEFRDAALYCEIAQK